MGPVVGNLSDRFGRRPILLIALAGLTANFVLLALAHSLPLLFLGQILAGMFGGTIGTCQAAIADMTAKEDRAHNFSLMGAAFGVGFIIGPALGGLLGELGQRMPFIAAACLTTGSFIFGWFAFPDTLAKEHRRAFNWRRANPLGALQSMRNMPGIGPILLVLMLWYVATAVYPLTWPYFGIARFNWSNGMIGLSLVVVGMLTATSQTFLTGRIVRRQGERGAAIIGLTGGIATFLAYAFVTESWMAFAIMVGFIPQSLAGPALTALLSNRQALIRKARCRGWRLWPRALAGSSRRC